MSFPENEFEIKGSFKSVIGKLFLFIFGFLFSFPTIVFILKPCDLFECGFGQLFSVVLLFFAVFVVWIKSYRIVLSDNSISYRSIFQPKIKIKTDEIKRTKYQSDGLNYHERKSGLYPKILLYPLVKNKKGPMKITLNVFEKNDLQKLYDLLESLDKLPFKRNVRKK